MSQQIFKAMFYLLINGQEAMDSPSPQIFSWKSVLIKIMKSWKDLIIEILNIFYIILFVQKYKLNINIKQSWEFYVNPFCGILLYIKKFLSSVSFVKRSIPDWTTTGKGP